MKSDQNEDSVNSIVLCDICGIENSEFTIKLTPKKAKTLHFYICESCIPHKKFMSYTVDHLWNYCVIN
ncbi:MAG: hypothetical protein RLZZ74_3421 [Cyanobacteriota bacterium]|jgi:hypothetical protein